MRVSICDTCPNKELLEAYAKRVTDAEDTARLQFGAGCIPGKIAIGGVGCVKNEYVDHGIRFCGATITPPEVPEHPDAAARISPATTIKDIPGFVPITRLYI